MTRPEEQHRTAIGEDATAPRVVFGHDGTFLHGRGRGDRVVTAHSDDPTLPRRVADRLGAHDPAPGAGRIAIGTLSFRRDRPASFLVPSHLETVDRSSLTTTLTAAAGPARTHGVRRTVRHEVPDADAYAGSVGDALEEIADGHLRKVVLGRWLDVVCDPPPTTDALLAPLLTNAPHAYVFALPPDAVAGSRASLVGASPELLVSRRGRRVRSVPLAGSVPRSPDPREDRRRADALTGSGKDLREHALVTDAIGEALRPVCAALDVPSRPHLIATDAMWHLATQITGTLHPDPTPAPSALALAQMLNPTPAVCGTPRDTAYRAIERLEPTDRGPITGAVGWVDADGDGEFALAIRSALIGDGVLRTFAGAGIVAGSEPAAEAAETAAKLRTVLRALEATQ